MMMMMMMIIYCPLVASSLGTRVRGIGVSDLAREQGAKRGADQWGSDPKDGVTPGSGRLPPGLYI